MNRWSLRGLIWGFAGVGIATSAVYTWFTIALAQTWAFFGWAVLLSGAVYALASVIGTLTLRRLPAPAAATLASLAVSLFVAADTYNFRLFQRHFDFATLRFTVQALRTRSVHPSTDESILVMCGTALCAFAFALMFRWLGRRRKTCRQESRVAMGVEMAMSALYLGVLLRDLLFQIEDPRAAPLFLYASGLKQQAELVQGDKPPLALGDGVVNAQFDALEHLAASRFPVQAARSPRILLIHAESLRHDMWNAVNMPKTFAWQQRCSALPFHYSTGNHTSTATFGVMTGLNGGYFPLVRLKHLPNLPLTVLAKLGYERNVWFPNATLLLDDNLATIFGDLATPHATEGDPTYLADTRAVASYLKTVASHPSKPQFDYLVLDSSHYDYQYPAEFAVNQPIHTLNIEFNRRTGEGKRTQGGQRLDPEILRGVFNRYKNSVLFIDAMIDRLLRGLESAGELDNSLVVIFGDHGEAFGENDGPVGHTTALDDVQTRVPLLFCGAAKIDSHYTYSSHADIFPTLFGLMGMTAPAPFMTGKSLATYDASLDFALVHAPVLGTTSDPRAVLVMDGMKLRYYALDVPLLQRVELPNDQPWNSPPAPRVGRLMGATVIANTLR